MDDRKRFEKWISGSPCEKVIDRFPCDEREYAWAGQYRDISVQLAWEAWSEALLACEMHTRCENQQE
jgi:hypothetical protein